MLRSKIGEHIRKISCLTRKVAPVMCKISLGTRKIGAIRKVTGHIRKITCLTRKVAPVMRKISLGTRKIGAIRKVTGHIRKITCLTRKVARYAQDFTRNTQDWCYSQGRPLCARFHSELAKSSLKKERTLRVSLLGL